MCMNFRQTAPHIKRCQIEEVADGERIYFYIIMIQILFYIGHLYYIGHLFII